MSDGITVPEEFQQKAHALVSKASKHELNHLSDHISARHEQLRNEAKPSKGGKSMEYSTADMPTD